METLKEAPVNLQVFVQEKGHHHRILVFTVLAKSKEGKVTLIKLKDDTILYVWQEWVETEQLDNRFRFMDYLE